MSFCFSSSAKVSGTAGITDEGPAQGIRSPQRLGFLGVQRFRTTLVQFILTASNVGYVFIITFGKELADGRSKLYCCEFIEEC